MVELKHGYITVYSSGYCKNTSVIHSLFYARSQKSREMGGLGTPNIPLLADFSKKMARDFGVLDEEEGIALRYTTTTVYVDNKPFVCDLYFGTLASIHTLHGKYSRNIA